MDIWIKVMLWWKQGTGKYQLEQKKWKLYLKAPYFAHTFKLSGTHTASLYVFAIMLDPRVSLVQDLPGLFPGLFAISDVVSILKETDL